MTDTTPRKRGPKRRYDSLVLIQAHVTPELRARYDAARGNSNHERMQAVIDERDELRRENAEYREQARKDFYANRDTWEREAAERANKQQEAQA
jgi:hypothetical protein